MENFKDFFKHNYAWIIALIIGLIVVISAGGIKGGSRYASYDDNLDNALKKMNTGEKLTKGEASAYRDFEEWVFENN